MIAKKNNIYMIYTGLLPYIIFSFYSYYGSSESLYNFEEKKVERHSLVVEGITPSTNNNKACLSECKFSVY